MCAIETASEWAAYLEKVKTLQFIIIYIYCSVLKFLLLYSVLYLYRYRAIGTLHLVASYCTLLRMCAICRHALNDDPLLHRCCLWCLLVAAYHYCTLLHLIAPYSAFRAYC